MSQDARQLRHQLSHERILDAAARALRRSGVAGVGVADVMRQAGLTHGGFYAHFASREALLTAALDHAGRQGTEHLRTRMARRLREGMTPLRALFEEYLSEEHMAADDGGCPVAALGSELPRTDATLRVAAAQRVRALVEAVRAVLPPDHPAAAAATVAATMSGALQMARVLGGDGGSALLRDCRATLIERYDRTA